MSMGHKCFISFKKEDEKYKQEIQSWKDEGKVDMIDKSLDTPINSTDEDYVMSKKREDYLSEQNLSPHQLAHIQNHIRQLQVL